MELRWSEVLLGLSLFAVASIGGIAVVSFLLVRLPATYFSDPRRRGFWVDRHPVLRWTGMIVKNLLGVSVIVLGIILALPGVPGPGILTILIGILLVDFPRKLRFERWLLGRPRVFAAVNRLRRRFSRPPLVLENPEGSARAPGEARG